jgi:hypothetical protein
MARRPRVNGHDLFSAAAAREAASKAAKKEAMDRVEANADPAWQRLLLKLVYLTCESRRRFTADQPALLYERMPEPKPTTHEKRAMGSVMRRAAKLGWCRLVEDVAGKPSVRRKLHHSPKAIWESLIYRKR